MLLDCIVYRSLRDRMFLSADAHLMVWVNWGLMTSRPSFTRWFDGHRVCQAGICVMSWRVMWERGVEENLQHQQNLGWIVSCHTEKRKGINSYVTALFLFKYRLPARPVFIQQTVTYTWSQGGRGILLKHLWCSDFTCLYAFLSFMSTVCTCDVCTCVSGWNEFTHFCLWKI